MHIEYTTWSPSGDSLGLVDHASDIIAEYNRQGYTLTLRQLYYQFVARDLIPNNDRSYKRLGEVINRARMGGRLDWLAIEDRTRNLAAPAYWTSPQDIIDSAAKGFSIDLWEGQPVHVEVWVEKEALAGVVARAADEWQVGYFSCRGYVSQSEQWRAARRFHRKLQAGKRVLVLHLGDHDPSGIDMTRDITTRLTQFILTDEQGWPNAAFGDPESDEVYGAWLDLADRYDSDNTWTAPDEDRPPFEVRRIALNYDQVVEYSPPPNPAKLTDSRATEYIERFGRSSWELDALNPATLHALISTHIEGVVDVDLRNARVAEEAAMQATLTDLAAVPWDDIVAFVEGR